MSVPANRSDANAGIFKELKGSILRGRMILEVPVQKAVILPKVLDYAKKKAIIIRDVNGKIYN